MRTFWYAVLLVVPVVLISGSAKADPMDDVLNSCVVAAAPTQAPEAFDKKPEVGAKATCPVTKHEFTVSKDTPWSVYNKQHYGFCCPACKPLFDADPGKYTKK